jgi:hypothetical protein
MLTIRTRASFFDTLRRHHLVPGKRAERLSYAFGNMIEGDGHKTIVIAGEPILLHDDCYLRQNGHHVSLHDDVRDGLMARFAGSGCNVLIDCHDHWFSAGGTRFSGVDDVDDRLRANYINATLAPSLARARGYQQDLHTASIVLDQAGCDARLVRPGGVFEQVSRIDLIGETACRIIPNGYQSDRLAIDPVHARHGAFMSAEALAYIAETRFCIAGCGGLGSIAAEALYRLGARDFVVIDDDQLEFSNLNRWQGAGPGQIGSKKATLLQERLSAISGGSVRCQVVLCSILDPRAGGALAGADVLIGCVDNDMARHFLNRVAVQFMLPYFDSGVNIRAGGSVDFESRFFAVLPGVTACTECTDYDLVDHRALGIALMDGLTARARRAAGYVEDRPAIQSEPSAYALNMSAVSTMMIEITNWVCGLRPLATCSYRGWRDNNAQRSDRLNHPEQPMPDCPACGPLLGAGHAVPLPRPWLSEKAESALLESFPDALSEHSD